MRIETLALEIGEMLNVKVQLYRQKDIGDEAAPKWVAASYERYYDEFDGIPITPFKIGLQTTIDWFKYLRGNLE